MPRRRPSRRCLTRPPAEAPARAPQKPGFRPMRGLSSFRASWPARGRHRAFVNDSPVTVGLLERLGEQLAEIHGQHEHQRLLQPLAQLELLDRFADAEDAVARMAALHAEYRAAAEELERLRGADRDRAQREDLLRFQVSELDAARLRVGEEEELRAERRRWQHAERFSSGLAEVTQLLLEDRDAAAGRVARAARVLGDLGRLDGAFADAATPLDAAAAQIEEADRKSTRLNSSHL